MNLWNIVRDRLHRLDVGRPDHFGPVLSLVGDEPAKVFRRAGERRAAQVRELWLGNRAHDEGSCCSVSGTACLAISGNCKAANKKVSVTTPKTLKLTQKSVVCVRQTISLSTARAKKNTAQRNVSLRHPSSLR